MVQDFTEIISRTPSRSPRIISTNVAHGTRTLTDRERAYPNSSQLHGIILCPDMLDDVIKSAKTLAEAKVKLDARKTDHKNWIAAVDPNVTHNLLTPVISSEMDTREWVKNVWLLPALAVLRVCNRKSAATGGIIFPDDTSDGPHITSAHGQEEMPIPDDLLYISGSRVMKDSIQGVNQVFEYKTNMAMEGGELPKIKPYIHPANDGTHIVIPFRWPAPKIGRANPPYKIRKQTKLIAQVYCQMLEYRVSFGLLTSYNTTHFFYRKKSEPTDQNILYISKSYSWDEPGTLAAIFSWLCLGQGLIQEELLNLPKLNHSCMKINQKGVPGADLDFVEAYVTRERKD